MKNNMLFALDEARVFTIRLDERDQVIHFTEGCDEHFTLALNKKDVQELIDELQERVNKLKDKA
jgi:hypothetical protein